MDHREMRSALERALVSPKTLTKHSVWEMLSNRQGIEKLIDLVPELGFSQIRSYATELTDEFSSIERRCLAEYTDIDFGATSAKSVVEASDNALIFRSIIRGEDYAPIIWKMIEPERQYD